ncbi:MAG: 50S ribosomal protein L6 [Candidatus Omnitrophica bacterium]|nr:50S ribosomal protein L6 [Candidatus Omnitrophota bacterium]
MSRLGKKIILLTPQVKVSLSNGEVVVEGPKGKLSHRLPANIGVEVKGQELKVIRSGNAKEDNVMYGTTRSVINNMVEGVSAGFQKDLEIQGVGYKALVQGKKLTMQLGFTHPIEFDIPEGITIESPKPTQIIIKGCDKVKVGETAAEIRAYYPPEPYKGKGVRYVGEYVRRKAGKSVA